MDVFTVKVDAPSLTVGLMPVQVNAFALKEYAPSLTVGLMPVKVDAPFLTAGLLRVQMDISRPEVEEAWRTFEHGPL